MPVRQSTPGPSTLATPADVLQPHNAKKRAVSEVPPDDEPRHPKKHRKDQEIPIQDDKFATATVNVVKDSKKKRKKKKRKSPFIIAFPEIARRAQSPVKLEPNIVPAPASLASSGTLSESPLPSPLILTVPVFAELLGGVLEDEDEKPVLSATNKGKGRALSGYANNLISPAQESTPSIGPSHESDSDSLKAARAQIAELTAQLQSQKALTSRHESNLHHLQQSLTCEICLDLLYKPYVLSPCGHVACYMCIIRWFTAVQNLGNANRQQPDIEQPNTPDDVPALLTSAPALRGIFLRNRKICPLCRASITERPAEIWSIKAMVSNLVKSKLVELPSAPPTSTDTSTPNADPAAAAAGNDPWLNVFPRPRHLRNQRHQDQNQFYPAPPEDNQEREQEGWGLEDMGMYDPEDGGIYRCIDCMHEIWGGVCTNCQREYPGHERFEDDSDEDFHDVDDDDDAHGGLGGNFLGRRLREIWRGYNEAPLGWGVEDDDDDDDVDIGEFHDAHADPMELTDDDDEEDGHGSISDEGHDLAVGVEEMSEDEDDEDSGGEWYTDDDDEDVDEGMFFGNLLRRHGLRRQLDVQPAPAGHIEEVDVEDQDVEHHENEGESDSDQHSHPDSEEDMVIDGDDEPYGHIFGAPGSSDEDEDEDRRIYRLRFLRELYGNPVDDGLPAGLIARRLGRSMRLGGAGAANSPPPPAAPLTRANSGGRRSTPIVVVDDDDDDLGDDEPRAGPSTRSHPRGRMVVWDVDDDSDDGDGDGGDGDHNDDEPRLRTRSQARSRAWQSMMVSDVDDDSDDSDHLHVDGEGHPEPDEVDDVEVMEVRPAGRRTHAMVATAGEPISVRTRRRTGRVYYEDDSE